MFQTLVSRRFIFCTLFCALFSCQALYSAEPTPQLVVEERWGDHLRGRIGDLPVLVLRGSAVAQAEAHGRLAADDIVALLNGYVIPRSGGAKAYQQVLRPMVQRMAWDTGWRAEIDALLSGMRAVLDPQQLQLAALDRPVDAVDLLVANALADWSAFACSTLSVWGAASKDGILRSARNLDYPANDIMSRRQCLVLTQPDDDSAAILSLGWFGALGIYTALNQHGVFLAIHDVPTPRPAISTIPGMVPRSLALRRALSAAQDASAVAAALDEVPVLMGNNIAVSDHQRALVIEWSLLTKHQARILEPNAGQSTLACTNHHRLPANRSPSIADSNQRLRRVEHATNSGPLTIAQLQTALRSVANANTVHSVIAEPANRRLYIARMGTNGEPAPTQHWLTVDWEMVTTIQP